MLVAVAVITYVAMFILKENWFSLVLQAITTALLLLRLRAIRCKINKFTVIEILAVVIPMLFALIFKRFNLIKFVEICVVRGIFYLYVKWDYDHYRFFTKTYTVYDDEIAQDINE